MVFDFYCHGANLNGEACGHYPAPQFQSVAQSARPPGGLAMPAVSVVAGARGADPAGVAFFDLMVVGRGVNAPAAVTTPSAMMPRRKKNPSAGREGVWRAPTTVNC